ncbi:hypothetical protein IAS59_002704 [Cryptococcus gattii]
MISISYRSVAPGGGGNARMATFRRSVLSKARASLRACTLDARGCVGNALGRISRTHSPGLKGIGGNIDVIRGEKGSWDSISATKVLTKFCHIAMVSF